MCRFHHRRHHEGEFRIRHDGLGKFTFTAADGKPLVPHVAQPAFGHLEKSDRKDPTLARAREGGAAFDYEYAVSALADASGYIRATESVPLTV